MFNSSPYDGVQLQVNVITEVKLRNPCYAITTVRPRLPKLSSAEKCCCLQLPLSAASLRLMKSLH